MMASPKEVLKVKNLHKADILAKPNVVGVGTGYKVSKGKRTGQMCIVALVRRKLPPGALPEGALVPREVDGIPIDVFEVGEIRAQQTPTSRWRPAPGGVSLGHFAITAGTLGCVVRDRATGERLILSNNHVLADSNRGRPGDAVLQPGAADGGIPDRDTIAQLERFIPIQFTDEPGTCNLAGAVAALANLIARLLGSKHRLETVRSDPGAVNLVDAALARPLNDADLLDEVMKIGVVSEVRQVELGLQVRKSGRTTGFTTGDVLLVDATVDIAFDHDRVARFEGQIITGAMSQGGDSGSLVVAGDPPLAVGLLFAGSDVTTVINPIQAVLDSLEVEF
jgi:hypothetical protein